MQPVERADCSLPSVAVRMAEKGVGIALIDHITATEHHPRNVVFRRFKPTIRRDIWLLRPRMRPRSRLGDEFVEMLYDELDTSGLGEAPASLFV